MADKKITFKIGGMSCASCAQTIEGALKKAKDVSEANVNFAAERATISYTPDQINPKELKKVVEST